MAVTLHNSDHVSVMVRSADGAELIIPANTSVEVSDKFLWNLPKKVHNVKGSAILSRGASA